MKIAHWAVARPVFTTMLALMVVVLGIFSLQRLRIDMLPDIEVPTITVRTSYEGADPEVVERLVTQIVEEVINTVPGVSEMSSESSEGRSQIRVSFTWGTDLDTAATDIRARLEEELSELPEGIPPPQIRKFNIANFPVVLLGVASDIDPVALNDDFVETEIRYRFARIPGVAQVDLWGGYAREIQLALKPDRLAALRIQPQDIAAALANANIDLPAGNMQAGRFEVVLRAPAKITNLDQLRDVIITTRDQTPIAIRDVADVRDTHAKQERLVRINGQRGIRVAIRKEK